MPKPNSMNTGIGRDFQIQTAKILKDFYKVQFQLEHSIPIGNPPKEHRFDIVSIDRLYVGECKNFSWTETGNVPSAKMGFINQAVFYLQFLSNNMNRFVVMRRDVHPRRGESLADYYFRTYRHLLNDIYILEIDLTSNTIRKLSNSIN